MVVRSHNVHNSAVVAVGIERVPGAGGAKIPEATQDDERTPESREQHHHDAGVHCGSVHGGPG